MIERLYVPESGPHRFLFRFVPCGSHVDIYCLSRPSFNGKDPSVVKTHLYDSGKICFVEGREPRSQEEAEARAKEWAEYFLDYRKTGAAQG